MGRAYIVFCRGNEDEVAHAEDAANLDYPENHYRLIDRFVGGGYCYNYRGLNPPVTRSRANAGEVILVYEGLD